MKNQNKDKCNQEYNKTYISAKARQMLHTQSLQSRDHGIDEIESCVMGNYVYAEQRGDL